MPGRKLIFSIFACISSLIIILGVKIAYSKNDNPALKVIFFNVGQGDAILVERGDIQMLIDGGPDGRIIMEKLGKYIPFWDRNLEVVVATHPDQDHIGGIIEVVENYKIGTFIDNGVSSESQAYKKLEDTAKNFGIDRFEGSGGVKINVNDSIKAEILSPDGKQEKNNPKDTNLSSLVIKLSNGSESFLLTGDATIETEKEMLMRNIDVAADYIKVGHHGSKYSTSDQFIDKVNAKQAVVSVGKNNYGHPSVEVLDRLRNRDIEIARTDEVGDVIYECADGEKCHKYTEVN